MRSSSIVPIFLFAIFGVFPFVLWTIFAMADISFLGYSGAQLFASYGAIMLSFLNGIVSGQVLENTQRTYSRRVMAFSNLITLLAWATLLMSIPVLSISLLLLGFISTFWLEGRCLKRLFANNTGYSKIRFGLITVICVLHVLVLFPQY